MTPIRMQKGTGIAGIVRDYVPTTSPEAGKLEEVGISPFSELFKKYKVALCDDYPITLPPRIIKNTEPPANITENLTSEQVNIFLQSTIRFEEEENYGRVTAIFLDKLILNSYISGKNNFVLVPPNRRALSNFGRGLGSTERSEPYFKGYPLSIKERPLILEIKGDLEEHAFYGFKNMKLTVYGNIGDGSFLAANFGSESEDAVIIVYGKAPWGFCEKAKRCIITVEELTDYFPLECGAEATGCTFRTSNIKTLEPLLRTASKDNRVVFLEADGTERMVKDF
ncbi:hypothetical protein HZC30_02465 [Candidatus Woesearchaeota archaeon]|nr:hypothetical protein [Candidatus Woesearchaeota archaeon]